MKLGVKDQLDNVHRKFTIRLTPSLFSLLTQREAASVVYERGKTLMCQCWEKVGEILHSIIDVFFSYSTIDILYEDVAIN